MSAEGFAYLPVVAEGVDDAAEAPAIFVGHGVDDGGSGFDGAFEGSVGVVGGEDHADGSAVEGFGAEVFVFGGFVGEPEARSVDGQVGNDGAVGAVEVEEFFGAEGGFVEGDGFAAVADGEEGGDGGWGAWHGCLAGGDFAGLQMRGWGVSGSLF